MKVLDTKFCKDYVTMADDGWQLGFHERNGGNFTYRLTDEEVASIQDDLTYDRPFTDIGTEVPALAGMFFMVTGSGKFFRWIKEKQKINKVGQRMPNKRQNLRRLLPKRKNR